jgi:hypothetical protein
MKEIRVEVLNLDRNFDIENGKPSIVVSFGNSIDSTPEVRERVVASGQTAQPDKTNVNRVILFVPDESEMPYTIGSKWILKIEDNGSVSITRDK